MLTSSRLQHKREAKSAVRSQYRKLKRKLQNEYGDMVGERAYQALRAGVLDQDLQKELSQYRIKPGRSRVMPCFITGGQETRIRKQIAQGHARQM